MLCTYSETFTKSIKELDKQSGQPVIFNRMMTEIGNYSTQAKLSIMNPSADYKCTYTSALNKMSSEIFSSNRYEINDLVNRLMNFEYTSEYSKNNSCNNLYKAEFKGISLEAMKVEPSPFSFNEMSESCVSHEDISKVNPKKTFSIENQEVQNSLNSKVINTFNPSDSKLYEDFDFRPKAKRTFKL